ncbi:MAG TPA: hypothetical protein VGO67_22800 [Verrucomicrobiae bacterium]|jgi:hypothetical protein
MKSFHADNVSEFLSWPLWEYLNRPRHPVPRSRAYRKNDNAHCEQKNWTHVRQLFGYNRFDQPPLVPLMNQVYKNWNLFQNHFHPTFKFSHKQKQGSKYKRTYQHPQTPYQRLLELDELAPEIKHRLKLQHQALNPFKLKNSFEQDLKIFFTSHGILHCEATYT